MCVAILRPANKHVSKRDLKLCWESNPHGAGFMYADNGKLIVRKGFMTFSRFYRVYSRTEAQHHDKPFVIHFRISTHGVRTAEMTHPFYTDKAKNSAYVHNGILSDFPRNEKLSDTALFAKEMRSQWPAGFWKEVQYKAFLEYYAEKQNSRFIFMDHTGAVEVFGEKLGVWRKGVWFSNRYWDWGFPLRHINTGYRVSGACHTHIPYCTRCEVCGGVLEDGMGYYIRQTNTILCGDCISTVWTQISNNNMEDWE